MSDALRDFCRSWLEWVERGAPERKPFSRCMGLCSCGQRFSAINTSAARIAVREQLKSDFPHPDCIYPFGGENVFCHEVYHGTIHLNPARLAWARKYAELEERHE